MFYCGTKNGSSIASLWVFKETEEYKIKVFSNLAHLECLFGSYGDFRLHGTAWYGSLLGGFPLGTVTGTFLVPPRPGFQAILVCWGSSDVPLVDSRGADPARAWWGDAELKSLVYILFALCIFLEYVFCLYFYLCMCVLLQLKTIWSNKCTRLY